MSYSGPQSAESLAADLRKGGAQIPNRADTRIPLFAIGFSGWKTKETIEEKLKCGVVDGIFVLDSQLYASNIGPAFASSLHSMVMFLEQLESQLMKTTAMLPVAYGYHI